MNKAYSQTDIADIQFSGSLNFETISTVVECEIQFEFMGFNYLFILI
jgi:hypothetical protein